MPNKIISITMVKNEADIIESFVRHTLAFSDALIIADHMSTDDTGEILKKLQAEGLPVTVVPLFDVEQAQDVVTNQLLALAIKAGADIVPALDADEFLIADDGNVTDLRVFLQGLDASYVYFTPWIFYKPEKSEVDTDKFLLSRPAVRMAEPYPMYKVIVGAEAVRKHKLHLQRGNHSVSGP